MSNRFYIYVLLAFMLMSAGFTVNVSAQAIDASVVVKAKKTVMFDKDSPDKSSEQLVDGEKFDDGFSIFNPIFGTPNWLLYSVKAYAVSGDPGSLPVTVEAVDIACGSDEKSVFRYSLTEKSPGVPYKLGNDKCRLKSLDFNPRYLDPKYYGRTIAVVVEFEESSYVWYFDVIAAPEVADLNGSAYTLSEEGGYYVRSVCKDAVIDISVDATDYPFGTTPSYLGKTYKAVYEWQLKVDNVVTPDIYSSGLSVHAEGLATGPSKTINYILRAKYYNGETSELLTAEPLGAGSYYIRYESPISTNVYYDDAINDNIVVCNNSDVNVEFEFLRPADIVKGKPKVLYDGVGVELYDVTSGSDVLVESRDIDTDVDEDCLKFNLGVLTTDDDGTNKVYKYRIDIVDNTKFFDNDPITPACPYSKGFVVTVLDDGVKISFPDEPIEICENLSANLNPVTVGEGVHTYAWFDVTGLASVDKDVFAGMSSLASTKSYNTDPLAYDVVTAGVKTFAFVVYNNDFMSGVSCPTFETKDVQVHQYPLAHDITAAEDKVICKNETTSLDVELGSVSEYGDDADAAVAANPKLAVTYTWWLGSSNLGTATHYDTEPLTSTTTYRVSAANAYCDSKDINSYEPITVVVNELPDVKLIDGPTKVCLKEIPGSTPSVDVTLTAVLVDGYVPRTPIVYTWYEDDVELTDDEYKGATITRTLTESKTYSYKVVAKDEDCVTEPGNEGTLDVKVNALPEFEVIDGPGCAGMDGHFTIKTSDPDLSFSIVPQGGGAKAGSLNKVGSDYIYTVNLEGIIDADIYNYKVVATTDNGAGCPSAERDVKISVNAKPVVSINPLAPICYGAEFDVVATQNVKYTYSWTGEGLKSTDKAYKVEDIVVTNDAYKYAGATLTYTVNVTDENGCKNSADQTLIINGIPKPTLTVDPNPVCAGGKVTATASTGFVSYTWQDASVTATNTNEFTIASATTISVVVSDGTCSSDVEDAMVEVTTLERPVLKAPTAVDPCEGDKAPVEISLSNDGGEDIDDFVLVKVSSKLGIKDNINTHIHSSDGKTAKWSYTPDNEWNNDVPVTLYFTATALNGCDMDGETVSVTIAPRKKPIVTPVPPIDYECAGFPYVFDANVSPNEKNTTLTWYSEYVDADHNTLYTGHLKEGITAPETVTYYVVATLENGCSSDVKSVDIEIRPVPDVSIEVSEGEKTAYCPGDELTLLAKPAGFEYLWKHKDTDPDGSALTHLQSVPVVADVSNNTYYVKVSSGKCYSEENITLNVLTNPTITITPSYGVGKSGVCEGTNDLVTFNLDPTNADKIKQFTLNGDPVTFPLSYAPASPVSWAVDQVVVFKALTEEADCEFEIPVEVSVIKAPELKAVVDASYDKYICVNEEVILHAGDTENKSVKYVWSSGVDGAFATTDNNEGFSLHAHPTVGGVIEYMVIAESSSSDKCQSTGHVTIQVRAPQASIAPQADVCDGTTVSLEGSTKTGGVNYDSYKWLDENGVTLKEDKSTNKYSVKIDKDHNTFSLVVTDGRCESPESSPITVGIIPAPVISSDKTSAQVCVGDFDPVLVKMTGDAHVGKYRINSTEVPLVDGFISIDAPAGGWTKGDHVYFIDATSIDGCEDSNIVDFTVTVNETPATPTASDVTVCFDTPANLHADVLPKHTYKWFSDSECTIEVGSKESFTTPSVTTSQTYYLVSYLGSCPSKPAAVTASSVAKPEIDKVENLVYCVRDAQLNIVPSLKNKEFADDAYEYTWSHAGKTYTTESALTEAINNSRDFDGDWTVSVKIKEYDCSSVDALPFKVIVNETTIDDFTPVDMCWLDESSKGDINFTASIKKSADETIVSVEYYINGDADNHVTYTGTDINNAYVYSGFAKTHTPGSYELIVNVVTTSGCDVSNKFTYTILDAPNPTITVSDDDNEICSNDVLTITASGSENYNLTVTCDDSSVDVSGLGGTFTSAVKEDYVITPDLSFIGNGHDYTTFHFSYEMSVAGCSTTKSVDVKVNSRPKDVKIESIDPTTFLQSQGTELFVTGSYDKYTLHVIDAESADHIVTNVEEVVAGVPNHLHAKPEVSGDLYSVVENSFGCYSETDKVTIEVLAQVNQVQVKNNKDEYCSNDESGFVITIAEPQLGVYYKVKNRPDIDPILCKDASKPVSFLKIRNKEASVLSGDYFVPSVESYTVVGYYDGIPDSEVDMIDKSFDVTEYHSPAKFNMTTGKHDSCTGEEIKLENGSEKGVEYVLYIEKDGSKKVQKTVKGDGNPLSFMLAKKAGKYYVEAYTLLDKITRVGCSEIMNGEYEITSSDASSATLRDVNGNFCEGSSVELILDNSEDGVTYYVYRDEEDEPAANIESKSSFLSHGEPALSLGNYNVDGRYSVVADKSGCIFDMKGEVNIKEIKKANTGIGFDFPVGEDGNVCGDGTLSLTISGLQANYTYTLNKDGFATAQSHDCKDGDDYTFTGLTAGHYGVTIAATDLLSCVVEATATRDIVSNPEPPTDAAMYLLGENNEYLSTRTVCVGDAVDAVISGAEMTLPVVYELYENGSLLGSYSYDKMSDNNGVISLPVLTKAEGTYKYTLKVKLTTNGHLCEDVIDNEVTLIVKSLDVTVKPSDIVAVVPTMTSTCYGADIVISNPQIGIYKLYKIEVVDGVDNYHYTGNSIEVVDAKDKISFTNIQSRESFYIVSVGNGACEKFIDKKLSVDIDGLPISQIVVADETMCLGDEGNFVSLKHAEAGITYQLYGPDGAIGAGYIATAADEAKGFTFPDRISVEGEYYVIGTNSCSVEMANKINLTVNDLPASFNLEGASEYCDDSEGVILTLSSSEPGVEYTLYKIVGDNTLIPVDDADVANPLIGSGNKLTFGKVLEGKYVASAKNLITHCTSKMEGVITVVPADVIAPFNEVSYGDDYLCEEYPVTFQFADVYTPGATYYLVAGDGWAKDGYLSEVEFDAVSGDFSAVIPSDGVYSITASYGKFACEQKLAYLHFQKAKFSDALSFNVVNECAKNITVHVYNTDGADTHYVLDYVSYEKGFHGSQEFYGNGGDIDIVILDELEGDIEYTLSAYKDNGCLFTYPSVHSYALPKLEEFTVTDINYCGKNYLLELKDNLAKNATYSLYFGSEFVSSQIYTGSPISFVLSQSQKDVDYTILASIGECNSIVVSSFKYNEVDLDGLSVSMVSDECKTDEVQIKLSGIVVGKNDDSVTSYFIDGHAGDAYTVDGDSYIWTVTPSSDETVLNVVNGECLSVVGSVMVNPNINTGINVGKQTFCEGDPMIVTLQPDDLVVGATYYIVRSGMEPQTGSVAFAMFTANAKANNSPLVLNVPVVGDYALYASYNNCFIKLGDDFTVSSVALEEVIVKAEIDCDGKFAVKVVKAQTDVDYSIGDKHEIGKGSDIVWYFDAAQDVMVIAKAGDCQKSFPISSEEFISPIYDRVKIDKSVGCDDVVTVVVNKPQMGVDYILYVDGKVYSTFPASKVAVEYGFFDEYNLSATHTFEVKAQKGTCAELSMCDPFELTALGSIKNVFDDIQEESYCESPSNLYLNTNVTAGATYYLVKKGSVVPQDGDSWGTVDGYGTVTLRVYTPGEYDIIATMNHECYVKVGGIRATFSSDIDPDFSLDVENCDGKLVLKPAKLVDGELYGLKIDDKESTSSDDYLPNNGKTQWEFNNVGETHQYQLFVSKGGCVSYKNTSDAKKTITTRPSIKTTADIVKEASCPDQVVEVVLPLDILTKDATYYLVDGDDLHNVVDVSYASGDADIKFLTNVHGELSVFADFDDASCSTLVCKVIIPANEIKQPKFNLYVDCFNVVSIVMSDYDVDAKYTVNGVTLEGTGADLSWTLPDRQPVDVLADYDGCVGQKIASFTEFDFVSVVYDTPDVSISSSCGETKVTASGLTSYVTYTVSGLGVADAVVDGVEEYTWTVSAPGNYNFSITADEHVCLPFEFINADWKFTINPDINAIGNITLPGTCGTDLVEATVPAYKLQSDVYYYIAEPKATGEGVKFVGDDITFSVPAGETDIWASYEDLLCLTKVGKIIIPQVDEIPSDVNVKALLMCDHGHVVITLNGAQEGLAYRLSGQQTQTTDNGVITWYLQSKPVGDVYITAVSGSCEKVVATISQTDYVSDTFMSFPFEIVPNCKEGTAEVILSATQNNVGYAVKIDDADYLPAEFGKNGQSLSWPISTSGLHTATIKAVNDFCEFEFAHAESVVRDPVARLDDYVYDTEVCDVNTELNYSYKVADGAIINADALYFVTKKGYRPTSVEQAIKHTADELDVTVTPGVNVVWASYENLYCLDTVSVITLPVVDFKSDNKVIAEVDCNDEVTLTIKDSRIGVFYSVPGYVDDAVEGLGDGDPIVFKFARPSADFDVNASFNGCTRTITTVTLDDYEMPYKPVTVSVMDNCGGKAILSISGVEPDVHYKVVYSAGETEFSGDGIVDNVVCETGGGDIILTIIAEKDDCHALTIGQTSIFVENAFAAVTPINIEADCDVKVTDITIPASETTVGAYYYLTFGQMLPTAITPCVKADGNDIVFKDVSLGNYSLWASFEEHRCLQVVASVDFNFEGIHPSITQGTICGDKAEVFIEGLDNILLDPKVFVSDVAGHYMLVHTNGEPTQTYVIVAVVDKCDPKYIDIPFTIDFSAYEEPKIDFNLYVDGELYTSYLTPEVCANNFVELKAVTDGNVSLYKFVVNGELVENTTGVLTFPDMLDFNGQKVNITLSVVNNSGCEYKNVNSQDIIVKETLVENNLIALESDDASYCDGGDGVTLVYTNGKFGFTYRLYRENDELAGGKELVDIQEVPDYMYDASKDFYEIVFSGLSSGGNSRVTEGTYFVNVLADNGCVGSSNKVTVTAKVCSLQPVALSAITDCENSSADVFTDTSEPEVVYTLRGPKGVDFDELSSDSGESLKWTISVPGQHQIILVGKKGDYVADIDTVIVSVSPAITPISFSGPDADPDVVEADWVDLGKAGKWRKFNLGASTPEGEGYYFAFGEIIPRDDKSSFTLDKYSLFDADADEYTRYVTDEESENYDGKHNLDSNDDAATNALGDDWKIPSKTDMFNLYYYCDWKWEDDVNGHAGYTVTAENGNSIFLPAYPSATKSDVDAYKNRHGIYATSTVCDETDDYILGEDRDNKEYGAVYTSIMHPAHPDKVLDNSCSYLIMFQPPVGIDTQQGVAPYYGADRYDGYQIRPMFVGNVPVNNELCNETKVVTYNEGIVIGAEYIMTSGDGLQSDTVVATTSEISFIIKNKGKYSVKASYNGLCETENLAEGYFDKIGQYNEVVSGEAYCDGVGAIIINNAQDGYSYAIEGNEDAEQTVSGDEIRIKVTGTEVESFTIRAQHNELDCNPFTLGPVTVDFSQLVAPKVDLTMMFNGDEYVPADSVEVCSSSVVMMMAKADVAINNFIFKVNGVEKQFKNSNVFYVNNLDSYESDTINVVLGLQTPNGCPYDSVASFTFFIKSAKVSGTPFVADNYEYCEGTDGVRLAYLNAEKGVIYRMYKRPDDIESGELPQLVDIQEIPYFSDELAVDSLYFNGWGSRKSFADQGVYYVVIETADGCEVSSNDVVIIQNPSPFGDNDPNMTTEDSYVQPYYVVGSFENGTVVVDESAKNNDFGLLDTGFMVLENAVEGYLYELVHLGANNGNDVVVQTIDNAQAGQTLYFGQILSTKYDVIDGDSVNVMGVGDYTIRVTDLTHETNCVSDLGNVTFIDDELVTYDVFLFLSGSQSSIRQNLIPSYGHKGNRKYLDWSTLIDRVYTPDVEINVDGSSNTISDPSVDKYPAGSGYTSLRGDVRKNANIVFEIINQSSTTSLDKWEEGCMTDSVTTKFDLDKYEQGCDSSYVIKGYNYVKYLFDGNGNIAGTTQLPAWEEGCDSIAFGGYNYYKMQTTYNYYKVNNLKDNLWGTCGFDEYDGTTELSWESLTGEFVYRRAPDFFGKEVIPYRAYNAQMKNIRYSNQSNITILCGNQAVGDSSSVFFIPNAISPNGDGFNEEFEILMPEAYEENHKSTLEVFNRWGTLVYRSSGVRYGRDCPNWDGTSKTSNMLTIGDKLPQGTYFYVFTISFNVSNEWKTHKLSGYVELRR